MILNKKLITIIATVLVFIGASIFYHYYTIIYGKNVTQNSTIYIPTNSNWETLETQLIPVVENTDHIKWVAKRKNYHNHIKAGKYEIFKGMNSNDLIDLLRSGKQEPVLLTFNNQHSLEYLAGRISQQIEADSISLIKAFKDTTFLQEKNITTATALSIYIPNSYQIFWNTNATQFRDKMYKEYIRFWNKERISKAKKLNMTKEEVSTLASIVQRETANTKERPTVAGLYLNRLRNGWLLQADPTVIFSLKEVYGQDTIIKRVLTKDLKINSPYNTYRHRGLPPGLISMPDISSIDAVLNSQKHTYYYMCASTEQLGSHVFAKTLRQHNKNAYKYQKWLSTQGINR